MMKKILKEVVLWALIILFFGTVMAIILIMFGVFAAGFFVP